jgi:hypothetical protein
MEPEALYHHVGRLIESMSDLAQRQTSPEAQRWLGQADALVTLAGDVRDAVDWRGYVRSLKSPMPASRVQAAEGIAQVLYRLLAKAELLAPPGVKGTFIPVGSMFDAFAAISRILSAAKLDVFIVDPYLDESALTEFGQAVPVGVLLRLLADDDGHKPTLPPAATKWNAQYGAARPLAVRLATPRSLHDRAIFVDRKSAWTLSQSLKDFAKRSPAEIVRADDTAELKIAAYEAIWANSKTVV